MWNVYGKKTKKIFRKAIKNHKEEWVRENESKTTWQKSHSHWVSFFLWWCLERGILFFGGECVMDRSSLSDGGVEGVDLKKKKKLMMIQKCSQNAHL